MVGYTHSYYGVLQGGALKLPLFQVLIPAGTMLYRSTPSARLFKPDRIRQQRLHSVDHSEKKVGVYFATYPLLSAAMADEYNKDLEFVVFCTTDEIRAYFGKYSVDAGNHFENEVVVIYDTDPNITLRPRDLENSAGEVFIQDENDLAKIQYLQGYKLSLAALRNYIATQHIPAEHGAPARYSMEQIYSLQDYIDHGVLTPIPSD